MRVGILGGAFNPPHIGHLICAQEAFAQLSLDVVVVTPVGEAPHRPIEDDPGGRERLEMCELAIAEDERLALSRIEVERAGPSYTVDTLRDVRGRAPDQELFLVMGGDQAATLRSWREPEEVLRLATVAVAEREGIRRDEISRALLGLAGAEWLHFFDIPRIDVSSTMIRRRAARGQPIHYLVPDGVAHYIEANGLYGASARVGAE